MSEILKLHKAIGCYMRYVELKNIPTTDELIAGITRTREATKELFEKYGKQNQ